MDLSFPHLLTAAEPSEGEDLRPLEWAGLCAQLTASRQLRRELARGGVGGQASFARIAPLAAVGSTPTAPGVNLEPLADGKAAHGISAGGDGEPARAYRTRGQQ